MTADDGMVVVSAGAVLHEPDCLFLRPDGITCTCGAFARQIAAAKLARTATTTTKETTMPDADDTCPDHTHAWGCQHHKGGPVMADIPPAVGMSERQRRLIPKTTSDEDHDLVQQVRDRLKAGDQTTGQRARAICEHAADLVNNDRNAIYGDAEQNFTETGALWAVVFGHEVTAEQVALCMALVKVARLIKTPNHADSWTDGVGYLSLGGGIASKPGRYV